MRSGQDEMDELLVLDGYNVIHAWPELFRRMNELDLAAARESLIDIMIDLKGSVGGDIIVVFDAHSSISATANAVVLSRGGITEIYTAKDQTADSYIEALVEKVRRADKRRVVRVVTGDALEQGTVLSFGAARMTVSELMLKVKLAKNANSEHMKRLSSSKRHDLEQRLPQDIASALEELRRG